MSVDKMITGVTYPDFMVGVEKFAGFLA